MLTVPERIVRPRHRGSLALARQATTARSVYAQEIAGKLARDGFGPHVDSDSMPGHVPIPAEFLKFVGRASSESSDRLYE